MRFIFFSVLIIIFYCSIDSFTDCLNEFKTKVEGIYPLAAENSENEVLLINSVGAYIITMDGNVDKKTSSITSTYSSDLIHYKDNIFFFNRRSRDINNSLYHRFFIRRN